MDRVCVVLWSAMIAVVPCVDSSEPQEQKSVFRLDTRHVGFLCTVVW